MLAWRVWHGLGEIYNLMIYPTTGHQIRDDDQPEAYANIWYTYDDTYVKVTAPLRANNYIGKSLYTGIYL